MTVNHLIESLADVANMNGLTLRMNRAGNPEIGFPERNCKASLLYPCGTTEFRGAATITFNLKSRAIHARPWKGSIGHSMRIGGKRGGFSFWQMVHWVKSYNWSASSYLPK